METLLETSTQFRDSLGVEPIMDCPFWVTNPSHGESFEFPIVLHGAGLFRQFHACGSTVGVFVCGRGVLTGCKSIPNRHQCWSFLRWLALTVPGPGANPHAIAS